MGEGGRVGALSGAERAPLPPPGQRGLLTFRGEGGVSGACPGESSRPGHPKGRKRRSGWDSGTDTKARTRELAFDMRGSGLWSALVSSAEGAEGKLMVLRASASSGFIHCSNRLYRRSGEA